LGWACTPDGLTLRGMLKDILLFRVPSDVRVPGG
jgi:hypothetical protein